jgi:hypothetical protein
MSLLSVLVPSLLSALLPAADFAVPRVDFDLHPGTLAFIVVCIALVGGLIAALLALSLYTSQRKRDAAHHDTWIDGSDSQADAGASDDVEPFVPDDAAPRPHPDTRPEEGAETRDAGDGSSSGDRMSIRNPDRVQQ